MSWGFTFAAKTKEAAKAEVDRVAAQPSSLPPVIAVIITDRIDALPDPASDRTILVETSGHIDSGSPCYGTIAGDAKFRVTLIALLGALLLFAMPTFAQEGPKFGGCLENKTTCFGPTVSVNVLAISLKTGDVTTQFSPGIGYGVTFNSDKWYKLGFSANFALKGTADGQKSQPSIVGSFAEYLRFGVTSLVGAGNLLDNAAVLIAFGSDFGSVATPEE